MTPQGALVRIAPFVTAALLGLQGCVTMAVGGGAAAGVAAAQERTVGDAVDDALIRTSINHHLLQEDLELFSAVAIKVVEGRVLLAGTVPTRKHRIDAIRLAWQADGVKEVINELQVSDEGGLVNYARDAWISAKLRSRLLFDKTITSINYNVETVNGVVYMIGIAQDEAELARVTNHARTIPHVRKVISHVRLKDDPRRREI